MVQLRESKALEINYEKIYSTGKGRQRAKIIEAMVKLEKKGKRVSLQVLSEMTNKSLNTLNDIYHDFIRTQIELLGITNMSFSLSRDGERSSSKLKKYREVSDKSLGIGLKAYNHFN